MIKHVILVSSAYLLSLVQFVLNERESLYLLVLLVQTRLVGRILHLKHDAGDETQEDQKE